MITREGQHYNHLKRIFKHRMSGNLTIRIGNINISIESGIQEQESAAAQAWHLHSIFSVTWPTGCYAKHFALSLTEALLNL